MQASSDPSLADTEEFSFSAKAVDCVTRGYTAEITHIKLATMCNNYMILTK